MANPYNIPWDDIKGRYDDWWRQCNTGRPLLTIRAPKVRGQLEAVTGRIIAEYEQNHRRADGSVDYADYWTNLDFLLARNQAVFDSSYYTVETYPKLFASLGVTSHAVFLGGAPLFSNTDTIWCQHIFDNPEVDRVQLDEDNPWLRWSLDTTRRVTELAQGGYRIGIPDLCENMDVMASLYNTQDLLFHMYDYEEEIIALTKEVQKLWFGVYDAHHRLVTEPDGYCNYGPFQLFGKGKIAKLQCDMSAMVGTEMFDTFALPFLREQTEWLDSSVYHLDGPDAVKHLDSVLSMERLTALQWTPGAGNADGGDPCWDFIYEKALAAGKSIYALVAPQNIPRFVKRFGHKGVLIATAAHDQASADEIVQMLG